MKQFYALLMAGLWLVSNPSLSLAQSTGLTSNSLPPVAQSDALRNKLDAVFQHVDKSQIPTGFLAEYGYPFIPLDLFNNTLTDSSRTNLQAYRYAFATFYSARVLNPNTLPTLDTVNARIATAAQTYSAIPIAMLRADYATLRADALTANLLRVQDEQLYDVAGRTQSPYLQKTAFLAAPARSYSETGSVALVFSQSIYVQNNSKLVSHLKVNFGDGRGFVQTSWGIPLAASYPTKGTKRIQVQLTYADGEVLTSHFDLEVLKPACSNCRYGDFVWPVTIPAVAGTHSGGVAYIRYGGNHTQLVKPLIVAEGFDASRIAPELQTNYSIRDFMSMFNNTGTFDFSGALDNIGNYDIVYIDYNNGTDDIRRNAALFRQVVAWVNANKAGSEQNVVLGISMGGLVARYGLAQMVKAGTNPQTRLLITHDSPHRGANTPLGLQALTRQANINVYSLFSTGSLAPAVAQARALLDEPASQQMLILRATDAEGGVATNTFLDSDYRTTITFPAGGPQPAYRTLATSLGSQCGVGSLAPSAELVRTSGIGFLSPIPWIVRTSINVEIIVNALPDYSSATDKRLSLFRLYNQYRIFFIPINFNIIRKTYYAPPNTLPWDGVAGGTQNVSEQAGSEQAGSEIPNVDIRFLWFLQASLNTTLAGDFCFVPTVSALDVADLNTTTIRARYVGGVPSASNARVSNFIAQERSVQNNQNVYNQTHPRFTARNSQWLFNEMQGSGGNTLNCSTECDPLADVTISGPSGVCSNTSYSIPPVSGVTYTWRVSPNLSMVSGQGTNSLTVAPNGNGNGTVSLTVTKNGCAFVFNHSVVVNGISMEVPSVYGPTWGVCPNEIVSFVTQAIAGSSYYEWEAHGTIIDGQGTRSITVRVPNYPSSWAGANVYARNNCSEGTRGYLSYPILDCGGGGGGILMSVFPNPASSLIEVSVTDASLSNVSNEAYPVNQYASYGEAYQVHLYDSYSQVRQVATTTGEGKLALDTSKLPNGIYYLRATRGAESISKQIVIQH